MHRSLVVAAAAFLSLAASGCLFADVQTPLAYRSPTPGDVGGALAQEVKGTACNHAVLGLVAWGDGGYDAAVKAARDSSQAQLIADVKADLDIFNVLFIYSRQCTTVSGRVVLTASALPPHAGASPPPPPHPAPPPPPPPGPAAPPPPPPPGAP